MAKYNEYELLLALGSLSRRLSESIVFFNGNEVGMMFRNDAEPILFTDMQFRGQPLPDELPEAVGVIVTAMLEFDILNPTEGS